MDFAGTVPIIITDAGYCTFIDGSHLFEGAEETLSVVAIYTGHNSCYSLRLGIIQTPGETASLSVLVVITSTSNHVRPYQRPSGETE